MASSRIAKLALVGGRAAVTLKPKGWPIVGRKESVWMDEVVRSGAWSWLGKHETAFCDEFKAFIGSRHAIALANGTVTLQCALQAVGVKPGDEVIVPGLTWVATAQAALDIGANVVLVDIDAETLAIDPVAIEKAITRKTRAIVPVHLYGCMCDMDAIMDIARRHKLKVVEDVAHQHGSRWRDIGAGAIGDAGSFSFQQSKVLTCGEGGAVTCNDDAVFETVFALKQVGWSPDGKPANRYGHNYRITEMQAVLLRGGMRRIADQTRIRDENAQRFAAGLAAIGGPLRAARRDPRVTRQAYYGMTLVYSPKRADNLKRADYFKALAAEGLRLAGPYAPVYANPLLNLYDQTSPVPFRNPRQIQNYRDLKLPRVERACKQSAAILMHTHLLSEPAYIDQLLTAVDKVNQQLATVRKRV